MYNKLIEHIMVFLLLFLKMSSLQTHSTTENIVQNNISNEKIDDGHYEYDRDITTDGSIQDFHSEEQNFEDNIEEKYDVKKLEISREYSLIQLYKLLKFSLDKPQNEVFERTEKVPQFLSELYESMTKSKNYNSMPYGAENIFGLLEKDPSKNDIFKFSLNGLENEHIIEAELHIYRLSEKIKTITAPYYLLKVYQILPTEKYLNHHLYYLNPDVHQLLNVHYISAFSTGWQVFKVKVAVQSWLSEVSPNLGLLVTITTILGEPVETIYARRGLHSGTYQPILVIYTKSKDNYTDPKKSSSSITDDKIENVSHLSYTHCQKHNLVIKFADLCWDKHIILPELYDLGECIGLCKAAVHQERTMKNYELLQTAIEAMGITDFRKPSCVPTKFGSLPILFYDLNENLVLKIFHNMKIERCGCL